MKRITPVTVGLAIAALGLGLAACSSVPVRNRTQLAQPVAVEVEKAITFELPERLRPSRTPSAKAGILVYQKVVGGHTCESCHGGDGGKAKPNMSQSDWVRHKTPPELRDGFLKAHPSANYDTALTLQEQWDVLTFCRFLSTTVEELRNTATALFGKNCNVCHGNKGFGNGFLSPTMQPQPRNLANFQEWGVYRSDDEIFYNIYYGVHWSGMPPWRHIVADADIWKIVDFIRSLQSELPDNDQRKIDAATGAPEPVPGPAPTPSTPKTSPNSPDATNPPTSAGTTDTNAAGPDSPQRGH